MREEEPDQLQANRAPHPALVGRPRCVERVVIEPCCLGHILALGCKPREREVHFGVLRHRFPKGHQHAARGVTVPLERERPCERHQIPSVCSIPNRCATDRVDRAVQLSGRDISLSLPKPLFGVSKAHGTIVRRDGPRDEERRHCNGDENKKLDDFPVNEGGAF